MMSLSKLQISLLCGLALLSTCFVNGKYTAAQVDVYAKLCNGIKEDVDVIKSYNLPTTETGKSYIKCVDNYLGMLDSDGKYSEPNIFEVLTRYWPEIPLDTIVKINELCFNETSKLSPTEWGTPDFHYEIWNCLFNELKKIGML